MGIDYQGILIYGIKHKWKKKEIKAIYETVDDDYFGYTGFIKVPLHQVDVLFIKVQEIYDEEPIHFIGLRYYKSKDYEATKIDLTIPELPELFTLQSVFTKLGLSKQNPQWYLTPQGT